MLGRVTSDALDEARRTLYRLPPDDFLAARATAAAAAEPALAAAITALRKHTVAAWIVNAYTAAHPGTVDELTGLGARLTAAQADLDPGLLRELTLERRRTVARITAAALADSGRPAAGSALRDDVSATFDAAVADPDVAAQLGALQRAQRWSGFGAVTPNASLALVTSAAGGPDTPAGEPDSAGDSDSADDPEPADDPRLARARTALSEADAALEEATTTEDGLQARLRRLTTRLTTLQHEIATVRDDLDAARTATEAARRQRRAAQAQVDRAGRAR